MKDRRRELPLFFALIFTFLSACIISRRLGERGSAVFALVYLWQLFFFLLFPVGCGEALRGLTKHRYASGAYGNAARIFRVALLTMFVYLFIVILCWLVFSGDIAALLLYSAGLKLPLITMALPFVLSSLSLLLLACINGRGDKIVSAYILMLRQLIELVMVFILSGRRLGNAEEVAALYKNSNAAESYEATAVVWAMAIASAAAFVLCLLRISHSARREKKEGGRKRESAAGMLYSTALPLCGAALALSSCEFILSFIMLRSYAAESSAVAGYQLGIYFMQYRPLALLPLAMIFMIHLSASEQVGLAVKGGDVAELRTRMKELSDVSGITGIASAIYLAFMAAVLQRSLFASSAAMGLRMLRFGAVVVLLGAFGLCSAMQLLIIKEIKAMILSCLISLAAALALFIPLCPQHRLGIYAFIPATSVFFLILSVCCGFRLSRRLRYVPNVRTAFILPFIAAAIPAAICWLLSLLLGLAFPALLVLLITLLLFFLLFFWLLCSFSVVNSYMLRNLPLGAALTRLGRSLKVLR